MLSISLWGGLGEPGEAYVKWGGKPSTLGAHAPTRGASPKSTSLPPNYCFLVGAVTGR
jgi:hypothetical protein